MVFIRAQSDATAQGVAKIRAAENARNEGERIFSDEYAQHFVRGGRVVACLGRLNEYLSDLMLPGLHAMIVGRTKLFDEHVQAAVADGATQFVILGAGYDARAVRLPLPEAVKVIEVDQPLVQARKRSCYAGIPGIADKVRRITFLETDFNRESVDETLRRCPDFDPTAKTVFLLEGVTQYIPIEATETTLRSISAMSAPGSRLVISYVDANTYGERACEVAGEGYPLRAVHRLLGLTRGVGEPWISGWTKEEFASFAADSFSRVVADESTGEANERYFTPLGRTIAPASLLCTERYACIEK